MFLEVKVSETEVGCSLWPRPIIGGGERLVSGCLFSFGSDEGDDDDTTLILPFNSTFNTP
jgi:hypothetical protein